MGWAGLMVLFCLTTCVESLSWTQLGAFTPMFLRQLGVGSAALPAWTAASASLTWVIALPLAPFWGVLADRYSRKAVIVRSAVVEAFIFAGWAMSTDPWMALSFRCLSGFVLGNTGVMLAVQATATPAHRLGLAIGIVGAGSPAGRALGPILGAGAIHLFGVRGMLLADAGASAIVAVLLIVLVREPRREVAAGEGALRMLRAAAAEIFGSPLLWRLFVAVFAAQLGLWVVSPFLPIFIARHPAGGLLAGAAVSVGAVLSAMGAAQALASPLWGRVVDRLGHRWVLATTSTGAAGALAAAGVSSSLPALTLCLVAYGALTAAVVTSNMTALAQTAGPRRRGAVLGLVLLPFYVSALLGPPLGALIFPTGQVGLFALAALVTLVPVAVVLTIPRPSAGRGAAAA